MTQAAPAGWYPDPENPTQQRYWDGAAWTQNVAPTPPTESTPLDLASPEGTPQPVVDAPVLQAWKTSVGFSVLGLLVGFPILASLSTLVAIPLMALVAFLTGNEDLFPLLGPLLWNVVTIVYAAKFYPSYFTEKPLLRSRKAISFANLTFGGLIFGSLWNGNLTKKTKGTSNVVLIALSAIFLAYLAVNIFVGLLFGAISGSTSAPGNASPDPISVDVGGVSVEVPAPANFVRLTPEMSELYALQSEFVPPNNEDLAGFISQEDAAAALAGERPSPRRRFSVQVSRSFSSVPVSKGDFAQFTETLDNDLGKQLSDVQDKLTGPLAEAGAALSEYSDTELLLEFSDTVPFPAHTDTDRMFAFSALQKIGAETAEGTSAFVVSGTSTLLYVNQRILFLYVFGGEDDLEWTREQSKNWADAILSANPE